VGHLVQPPAEAGSPRAGCTGSASCWWPLNVRTRALAGASRQESASHSLTANDLCAWGHVSAGLTGPWGNVTPSAAMLAWDPGTPWGLMDHYSPKEPGKGEKLLPHGGSVWGKSGSMAWSAYRPWGGWCWGARERDHLLDGQTQLQAMQGIADANLPLDFSVRQGWHDGSTLHVGSASGNVPGRHPHPELPKQGKASDCPVDLP